GSHCDDPNLVGQRSTEHAAHRSILSPARHAAVRAAMATGAGSRLLPVIFTVAAQRDRAAFGMLFEYFAPRIKTYMQRSGATEASAEELAQETMLTVWRKASMF